MARIAKILSVEDSVQEGYAYVNWIDMKGKKGSTFGKVDNFHMVALIKRAKRENVLI